MGLAESHSSLLRELAEEFAKPLFILYYQSWPVVRSHMAGGASVTPMPKKGCRDIEGNSSPVSQGKVLEQIIVTGITRPREDD